MPIIKTLKNGQWTPVNSVTSLATATQSTAGLMSASDKVKLDGIGFVKVDKSFPSASYAETAIVSLDLSNDITDDYSPLSVVRMADYQGKITNAYIIDYNPSTKVVRVKLIFTSASTTNYGNLTVLCWKE